MLQTGADSQSQPVAVTRLARAWWSDAVQRGEQFFELFAKLDLRNMTADYVIQMVMVYEGLEKAGYAGCVAPARSLLLNAVICVIRAISAAEMDDMELAQSRMDEASVILRELEDELARLGVM